MNAPALKVLLADGDLMAQARLDSAASAAGASVEAVAGGKLVERLRGPGVDLVVLDLDRGRAPLLEAVETARAEGIPLPRVVGFLSHVDDQLADAASRAGCEAIPRGRFWRSLPELLGETSGGTDAGE
jgi:CheY-like chemotaxis protein